MKKRNQVLGILLICCMLFTLLPGIALAMPAADREAATSIHCCVDCDLDDQRGGYTIDRVLIDVEMEDGSLGWCPIIYERQQAEQEVLAKVAQIQMASMARTNSDSNHHGELRVLHQATQTTNRIVIKMVADRYTEDQQEEFFAAAQNIANHIVSVHPLYYFAPWIQIYGIGTISEHQNMSVIVGDGSAGTGAGQIILDNLRPFVQHHFPGVEPSRPNNHSWLVIQRGRTGGWAWSRTPIAVTNTSPVIGLHEIAHLWDLWDEYDTHSFYESYLNMSNVRSNVDLTNPTGGILSNLETVNTAIPPQWGLFIGETPGLNNQWQGIAGMGIYRMFTYGWEDTTWYRPSQYCVMNQPSTNRFCLVCAEHLARRFAPNRIDNTRIRSYAYAGNTSLETITIPATVAAIGDFAFIGATGLEKIYNYRAIPQQINQYTFAGLNRQTITVTIPFGTTQAYIDAGWYGFNLVERDGATIRFHLNGTGLVGGEYIAVPVTLDTSGEVDVMRVDEESAEWLRVFESDWNLYAYDRPNQFKGYDQTAFPRVDIGYAYTGAYNRFAAAFWGWFDAADLDPRTNGRNDIALDGEGIPTRWRPSIGCTWREVHPGSFFGPVYAYGEAEGINLGNLLVNGILASDFEDGYLDFFGIWIRWGDVNDDGVVYSNDEVLLNAYMGQLAWNLWGIETQMPVIHHGAANVVLRGYTYSDANVRINQFLGDLAWDLWGFPVQYPTRLGARRQRANMDSVID